MQDHNKLTSLNYRLVRLKTLNHKVYGPSIRARLGTAAHLCEAVVLKLRTAFLVQDHNKTLLNYRLSLRSSGVWSFYCLYHVLATFGETQCQIVLDIDLWRFQDHNKLVSLNYRLSQLVRLKRESSLLTTYWSESTLSSW